MRTQMTWLTVAVSALAVAVPAAHATPNGAPAPSAGGASRAPVGNQHLTEAQRYASAEKIVASDLKGAADVQPKPLTRDAGTPAVPSTGADGFAYDDAAIGALLALLLAAGLAVVVLRRPGHPDGRSRASVIPRS